MYTDNGGVNWEVVPFPTMNGLHGVTAVDPLNAWAVGNSGIILSTSDLMVSMQEDFPSDFQDGANDSGALNLNIYPIPANGITNIEYWIPVRSLQSTVGNSVSLGVFDVHGKELICLVNEKQAAGEHQVRFYASELPAGIYLIRLQAGNEVQTKKIIKL